MTSPAAAPETPMTDAASFQCCGEGFEEQRCVDVGDARRIELELLAADAALRRELAEAEARVRELGSENELLSAERSSAFEAAEVLLPALGWEAGGLGAAAHEIVAKLAAAEADKRRYQWLRNKADRDNQGHCFIGQDEWITGEDDDPDALEDDSIATHWLSGAEADAAIDAAISADEREGT